MSFELGRLNIRTHVTYPYGLKIPSLAFLFSPMMMRGQNPYGAILTHEQETHPHEVTQ